MISLSKSEPNKMDCSKVKNNLDKIKSNLANNCQLITVSKYRTIEEINCSYDAGQRAFAENRVQALVERKDQLPADIEWHLIGNLQRNKVKYLAPFIHLIHSVDSFKLLKEINKQAMSHDRVIDCLLQVHIAKEETKFGLNPTELIALLKNEDWRNLSNVRIVGLMAMATNTDNEKIINQEFGEAQILLKEAQTIVNNPDFKELSIGMTGDYLLAQNFGSTLVRIGSGVFD